MRKDNVIAVAGAGVIIAISAALAGLVIVRPALAQVDATSTDPVVESTTPVETVDPSLTSTTDPTDPTTTIAESTDASSTPASEPIAEAEEQTTAAGEAAGSDTTGETTVTESFAESAVSEEQASQATITETAPDGLTEVHIIGTKYIDYFTDGTNTYTFPGDPEIHAHIAEKDAPIPTHEGMTWVHSTGHHLFDTASGDLEVGQYAVQADGSIIANQPPFVSSTSTPATIDASASTSAESTTSTSDASASSSATGEASISTAPSVEVGSSSTEATLPPDTSSSSTEQTTSASTSTP